MKFYSICFFIMVAFSTMSQDNALKDFWSKDIIILDSNQLKIEEREAILVLTGFGSVYHSAKNQKLNFKQSGYDLFIPDYIDKKSIALCSEHLEDFIVKQQLAKYKKIQSPLIQELLPDLLFSIDWSQGL